MSKRLTKKEKVERLSPSDQDFIRKYEHYEDKIRAYERSTFSGTLTDHLKIVNVEKISEKSEVAQINEVLSFHHWVCGPEHRAHDVSLPKILVSYEDLFAYCKMRVETLGLKIWSQSKLCMAILRMIQFMESGEIDFDNEDGTIEKAILEMKGKTRDLLANAKRESDRETKERPSVDELREQGKMLTINEVVKVCQRQEWRVKFLVENQNRSKEAQHVIDQMLPVEAMRWAVICTLLTYSMRKGELQACVIDTTATPWRLKLSADRRKSGQPINNRLSREEMELFELLLKLSPLKEGNETGQWQPFQGVDTTEILKATTSDIAGVPMTIMNLRTAAESYADLTGKEDIQNALSYAQGHTDKVAKQYYKRNGSTTKMKSWTDHIRVLIRGQEQDRNGGNGGNGVVSSMIKFIRGLTSFKSYGQDYVGDNIASAMDEKMEWRMEQSQQTFKEHYEKRVRDIANEVTPVIKRKARENWTEEEDIELRRLVQVHGKGNWKDMFDDSPIMQRRYQTAPTVFHARDGLKTRWRVLSSHAETRHSGVKRSVDGRIIHKELATKHWVPVVNHDEQQPRGEEDHTSNSVVYPSGSHDDTAVQQVDERSTQERGDNSRRIKVNMAAAQAKKRDAEKVAGEEVTEPPKDKNKNTAESPPPPPPVAGTRSRKWTTVEDHVVIKSKGQGKQWSFISTLLQNRTESAIESRWNDVLKFTNGLSLEEIAASKIVAAAAVAAAPLDADKNLNFIAPKEAKLLEEAVLNVEKEEMEAVVDSPQHTLE